MKRSSRIIFVALLISGLSTRVQAKPKYVLKLGTVAPDGTPWSKQILKIKRSIEKESKGRIKVKVYTGFAKGGEKEIVRRCVRGTLQMCGTTVGAIAAVAAGDLNVLEFPYLFKDSAEADRILDGPALPQVKKILAKKGLVFYGWSENGWRGYGTRKAPIRKPRDLKGLRMRAQESRVHVLTYKALGALPVPIALPEVLGSLQRGVVDGFDNTELYLIAASWYKHIRFFSRTKHIYQPAIIAYNKAYLNTLPADLKKIVLAHSAEVASYGRKLIRKITKPLIDNLKAQGIKVIEVSPAQRAAFAKKTKKVHRQMRRRLTADGRKLLSIIYKAKKK